MFNVNEVKYLLHFLVQPREAKKLNYLKAWTFEEMIHSFRIPNVVAAKG
jgi:hypothetical protein